MAKKNKKNKNKSLWKNIKPYAKNNKALLSILGAVGVGAALASVIGPEKISQWIGQVSDTLTKQGRDVKENYAQSTSKVKPVVS